MKSLNRVEQNGTGCGLEGELTGEPRRWVGLYEALVRRLSSESRVALQEPLAKRTTLRVGGCADFFVEPASEEDLGILLRFCAEHALPVLVFGRGSNLIVRDGGVRGVVVSMAHKTFRRAEFQGDRVICGAGARLKALAMESKRHGLAGLEFLEGIPGTVGGALRMNAGAMGRSFFDVVERLRFMDFQGRIQERAGESVPTDYRCCPFLRQYLALGAILKGEPGPPEQIGARLSTYSHRRRSSQPAASSAGCIFKNPEGIGAGRLIEELGLKGKQIGGAMISPTHGNFIVNTGRATASEVLDLIEWVRHCAWEQRGIVLETEVQIVGE